MYEVNVPDIVGPTPADLRTKPENSSHKRLIKRDDYLKKQPVIESIYHFKQKLYRMLMKKTMGKRMCRRVIPVFLNVIKSLKQSPFKKLQQLGGWASFEMILRYAHLSSDHLKDAAERINVTNPLQSKVVGEISVVST